MDSHLSSSKTGSLETLIVDNQHAICRISLFGAHVLSFMPKHDGRERLWMSDAAILDGNKPIRGGVPVCWPWFANSHGQEDSSLPSHGFLRTQNWQLISQSHDENGSELVLQPGDTNGPGFSYKARVSLVVNVGKRLTMTLNTENADSLAFPLSMALHTYFNVNNIDAVEIKGIEGDYKDKLQNWAQTSTPQPYGISEETDRIHLTPASDITLQCNNATTRIRSEGHDSIVVWNPWSENSQAMADMKDDGYKTMICIETALTQGYLLQPGESHGLTQIID